METLLLPCLTVLLNRSDSTLFDLLRFMNDERNTDLVELGKNSKNKSHALFFKEKFHETNLKPTKQSISIKTQSLLHNEVFANIIARPKSTIDLKNAIESGKAIIINCAKGNLGDQISEAFGRFIVALISNIAISRTQKETEKIPIDLIIDE
jgi:hypothetical protein